MLALRDLFGYSFRELFGAALEPPTARAVAMQNFRRSRHAADQAPTRDSKLSDALLRAKGLRPELRGDRGQLQLQLARDGARAPEQSRAEGLHQALVQREPRDRDPAERDGAAVDRASLARRGGGGRADRGDRASGDDGGPRFVRAAWREPLRAQG